MSIRGYHKMVDFHFIFNTNFPLNTIVCPKTLIVFNLKILSKLELTSKFMELDSEEIKAINNNICKDFIFYL